MMEVMRPDREEAVVEVITTALAAGGTIELRGAGTKVGLGRPVQASGRLDLAGLSGITLYEPAELVLSARAGTPLRDIETTLAANGQALAFEPPDLSGLLGGEEGQQTIGGIVATNLSGPRRCAAGAVRDHLLGARAVNGMGELFKAGGRVVKNVTGYDLCKVLTGSFGTLAALTEVTLKVLPAAETEATVVVRSLAADAAVRLMALGLGSPTHLTAAAWLPATLAGRTAAASAAGGGSAACLRLEGFGPSVAARQTRLLDSLAKEVEAMVLADEQSRLLWRQLRDVAPFHRRPDRAVWKLAVRPSQAGELLRRLEGLDEAEVFLDWGGALAWLSVPCGDDASAEAVRRLLPEGGHATLVAAPEAVRAAQPVFQPQPPAVAALEARLKASFDPQRLLNPGRMAATV